MISENCNDNDKYKKSFKQFKSTCNNILIYIKKENNNFQKSFEKLNIKYDNILQQAKEEYNNLTDVKKE